MLLRETHAVKKKKKNLKPHTNWQVLIWSWPGLVSPHISVCDSMVPIHPFFFLPINVQAFSVKVAEVCPARLRSRPDRSD